MSYINLTVNFRAISHEQYLFAGGTAALAAVLAYTIVKKIAKQDEDTLPVVLGMATGGAFADMVGIYLTRTWG